MNFSVSNCHFTNIRHSKDFSSRFFETIILKLNDANIESSDVNTTVTNNTKWHGKIYGANRNNISNLMRAISFYVAGK